MSFLSKIGSALSSVTKFANKALSIIKAPMEFITKPLMKVVEKVADKLPFGLGNLVKPFAQTFLNNALAWLAGGPLGGVMAMLTKIVPTAEKIVDFLNVADRMVNGGLKNMPEPALENARNAVAYAHARSLAA